tara:strand:- start:131 stop:304 length:174 start_codon:yes stop_codon:yes gene_type:complete
MEVEEKTPSKTYVVHYVFTDKYGKWDAHRVFHDRDSALAFSKVVRKDVIKNFKFIGD